MYSENGTNFKGAERLLHALDWDSILARAAEETIQWKFNPPSAPWWGGWWECLVQMTKAILRKILGRAALDYEELITVLSDWERVINSRPLTYVSEDVDDVSPLTPEMFLREVPESGVSNIDIVDREKLSKRAKYLQKMRQQLRSKFRIEYLGQLRQQSIKNYKDKPLSVGEIVLLEANSEKGAYWSLARVLKLIPGRDGHIGFALIKTGYSEFLCGLCKGYSDRNWIIQLER
ncbi:integrase catalytic domain-containing protein [Trichonephila clavipes]|nr:integrase catalytic domain-containing protein [Trichonephila clavipes]